MYLRAYLIGLSIARLYTYVYTLRVGYYQEVDIEMSREVISCGYISVAYC